MKKLNQYILEKFKISKNITNKEPNIIVFDTENCIVMKHFFNIDDAQQYADKYDKISGAKKKIIKSSKHNLIFIVIDFDNLTPEAKECIKTFPDELKNSE